MTGGLDAGEGGSQPIAVCRVEVDEYETQMATEVVMGETAELLWMLVKM